MSSPERLERLLSFAVEAAVSGAVANCILAISSMIMPSRAASLSMVAIAGWTIAWCFVAIVIVLRLETIRNASGSQTAFDARLREANRMLDEMAAERKRIMDGITARSLEAKPRDGNTHSGTAG